MLVKKKMLLHCCCGPCASDVVGNLINDYDVTLFYYNPSIFPFEEYKKRFENLEIVAKHYNVNVVYVDYNQDEFLKIVAGMEQMKEGGTRCEVCIFQRLEKTCLFAKENGFDIFATTLSVSPHKNASYINSAGKELSKTYNVEYLESDFKKKDGFKKSIEMSKKLGLYRQDYCGCKFSLNSKKTIEKK